VKRCIVIFWSVILIFSALPASAGKSYPQIYKFYMEQGKLALERQDYNKAYYNFRRAQLVAPTEKDPTNFINLIKRIQDDRIVPKPVTKIFRPFRKSRAEIIGKELDRYAIGPPPKVFVERDREGRPEAAQPTRWIDRKATEPATPETAISKPPSKYIVSLPKLPFSEKQSIVYLDSDLWQTQPRTLIRIVFRESTILDANNIKRYLAITPDIIEVKRIDKDRINIIAKNRGSTLFHVWDDTGRWTFKIEVILSIRKSQLQIIEEQIEQLARPFKISHSVDWSSFYRGQSFREAKRENLNFLQRVLVEGETPYGDFDSHVIFNKFDESTEVTGYGVGLTNGKIGNFKDFRIRGFDIRKTFSPLTMPGQYVRGVLFEAKAFNKNLEYTYIHGRDRQIFGFLSPNVREKRESFVEGVRVTLFPEKENQYSVNYARGYGDARESFLKDQVFSFEAQHRLKNVLLSGEIAYDEDVMVYTARSLYKGDQHTLMVNFRNMDEDFTTVTSSSGNRGEIGGSIFWNWKLQGIDINTSLDLYSQRFMPNPENEGAVNVDFSTTVNVPISSKDNFSASVYYVDTAASLSPQNSERVNLTYTKHFQLGKRDLTAFAGAGQQRVRFDSSSSSEFDRYSLSTGFSVPLIKRLNFFTNYDYSLVYEEQSGDLLTPNVMNAGLNYSKKLTDDWSMRTDFSYRNEEKTEGKNSFLAGEDNISGSIGATYRPNQDFEFFVDGRVRNVWAEAEGRSAFNEIDILAGIRTSWDVPFRWNPQGTIRGTVFKDLNANQRQDDGEDGVEEVSVKVGKKTVITDVDGNYQTTVKAKSVSVEVDINTIPNGFIFSTPILQKIEIIPHKVLKVDFGITTESGIYGIVYYDTNGSGKPDSGDEFAAKVQIILDGKDIAVTDFEGTYFFQNVQTGKHQIRIDVNSLPIEYLPKIKIKNEMEVSEGSTYVFHIPLTKVSSKDK